jgi:hypothetical protein
MFLKLKGKFLAERITDILQNGKTAVLAIKKRVYI